MLVMYVMYSISMRMNELITTSWYVNRIYLETYTDYKNIYENARNYSNILNNMEKKTHDYKHPQEPKFLILLQKVVSRFLIFEWLSLPFSESAYNTDSK